MDAAQRRVKSLQKEVNTLRGKLDAKIGYDKIVELENKLKETETKYSEYQEEYKGLELIKKKQEKELESLMQNKTVNTKIEELNKQLKQVKERNKELEKKMQLDTANYQKQHVALIDLQEKIQKAKEERLYWKKAIADGLPPFVDTRNEEDKNMGRKSEDEMIRNSIILIKRRIEFERSNSKKQIESLKAELAQLQLQIKEVEQENKLNSAKLKELKPLLKHNQLKPLNMETTNESKGSDAEEK